jgi:class 3 adenylate cyclase
MSRVPSVTAQLTVEELVFAITSVSGATAATRSHGDRKTVAVLSDYYALVATSTVPGGGRVVKVMGDAVLVVFPVGRAQEAVDALRLLQTSATALWSSLDARCRVQVKIGIGALVAGAMGPPGDERFDVYGTALNELFKAPAGDLVIAPDLAARLP